MKLSLALFAAVLVGMPLCGIGVAAEEVRPAAKKFQGVYVPDRRTAPKAKAYQGVYVPPSVLLRQTVTRTVKLPPKVAGPEAPEHLPEMKVTASEKVCKPCDDVEMSSLDQRPVQQTKAAAQRKNPAKRVKASVRRPYIKTAAAPRRYKARVVMSNQGVDCDVLRQQAQALMDRGDTQAADKMLKAALKAEPGRPCLRAMVVRLALCRAHSAISCKNFECAARRLREVLYLEPDNRVARSMLNDVYSLTGVDPNNPQHRENLAQCLANNGRHVGALVEYREASKLAKSSSTHIGLAKAALQTDHKSLALAEFRKAVGVDPFNPRTWQQIGFLEESRGQPEKAAAAFLEAARINPSDVISVEKALQVTQSLANQFPQSIDRKLDLVRSFLASNQSDKAAQVYRQIGAMQPDTPQYEDWVTLEAENIALKRTAFEHQSAGAKLASNDVFKFLTEGPQPETGAPQIDQSTGKLQTSCNCD